MRANKFKLPFILVIMLTFSVILTACNLFGGDRPAVESVEFVQVAAGGTHSLALDSEGNIWSFGSSWNNGHGNTRAYRPRIIRTGHGNTPLPAFVYISASWGHSIAICEDGNIWTWGNGAWYDDYGVFVDRGWLGHGEAGSESRPRMIIMPEDEEDDDPEYDDDDIEVPVFTAASAAHQQSAALDEDGNIWTWGGGYLRGLGHGESSSEWRPRMIETGFGGAELPAFTAISMGEFQHHAICEDGNLWVWRDHGPRMIDGIEGLDYAVAISSGRNHNMMICGRGYVWTWGANAAARLLGHAAGEDGRVQGAANPQRIADIEGLTNITAISAGYHFSMAVCGEGYIWTWGNGASGKLGHGGVEVEPRPRRIEGVGGLTGVLAVSAGSQEHSIAVDGEGRVWTWGRASHGQLGHSSSRSELNRNVYTPRMLR